jgi:hypothetical protein
MKVGRSIPGEALAEPNGRTYRRRLPMWIAAALALALGAGAVINLIREPAGSVSDTPGSVELIGHEPLMGRGLNSAIALHGDYAYVGSRSDGSHENAGVLVVDISDPAQPRVVGEVGPPGAANPGVSSRELRVWPQGQVLISLNLQCHPVFNLCEGQPRERTSIRFFDLRGDRATSPRLLASEPTPAGFHEFFLWVDPDNSARALLYVSDIDGIAVLDISHVRDGRVVELATWDVPEQRSEVHSVSVSPDGRRAYIAALGDGAVVVDTSELADNAPDPSISEITSPQTRPSWGFPGPHSAIPIPGTGQILTTDEVYGACPWGWVRVIDASDEAAPTLRSEYRVNPWNESCLEDYEDRFVSFSSHNPTATQHLALVTWHSAGLQVVGLDDLDNPQQLGVFLPDPLEEVANEDPELSAGTEKVVMWSYPVIRYGLIHVVDIRNGLYILRYTGPYQEELDGIGFLEGNSNVGYPLTSAGG